MKLVPPSTGVQVSPTPPPSYRPAPRFRKLVAQGEAQFTPLRGTRPGTNRGSSARHRWISIRSRHVCRRGQSNRRRQRASVLTTPGRVSGRRSPGCSSAAIACSAGRQAEDGVAVEHRVNRADRPGQAVVGDRGHLAAFRLGQCGAASPPRRWSCSTGSAEHGWPRSAPAVRAAGGRRRRMPS